MQELLAIASDPTLASLHDKVMVAFSIIVLKSGANYVGCLSKVKPDLVLIVVSFHEWSFQMIPVSLQMVEMSDSSKRPSLITELAKILSGIGLHVRPYAEMILTTCIKYWVSPEAGVCTECSSSYLHRHTAFQSLLDSTSMGIAFLSLLRSLMNALKWEFAVFMPVIMAHGLKYLSIDTSEDKIITIQV